MILDPLSAFIRHPSALVRQAAQFLVDAPVDLACGDHRLDGDDLVVKVMEYSTRERPQGVLETHRLFADLQVVLAGEEILEWFDRASLQATGPYDPSKDAIFYRIPSQVGTAVHLRPGLGALLLADDAHMGCLRGGLTSQPVRKAVVKIRLARMG